MRKIKRFSAALNSISTLSPNNYSQDVVRKNFVQPRKARVEDRVLWSWLKVIEGERRLLQSVHQTRDRAIQILI
jgi:hypothetical protein